MCSRQALKHVESVKYLGILIDQNLNRKMYMGYVLKKLRFGLVMLNRLKEISSLRLLRVVYFCFFHHQR